MFLSIIPEMEVNLYIYGELYKKKEHSKLCPFLSVEFFVELLDSSTFFNRLALSGVEWVTA